MGWVGAVMKGEKSQKWPSDKGRGAQRTQTGGSNLRGRLVGLEGLVGAGRSLVALSELSEVTGGASAVSATMPQRKASRDWKKESMAVTNRW